MSGQNTLDCIVIGYNELPSENAYPAHALGLGSLQHSRFLTFSETPANRIIALPACLGDGINSADKSGSPHFLATSKLVRPGASRPRREFHGEWEAQGCAWNSIEAC